MGCNMKITMLVAAIIGLVLIVVAAVLGFAVLPGIIDDKIDESVILDETGTDQYKRFEKLPFPLNFSITYFHVKNPDKVMDGSEYADVEEIGPIVYGKELEKIRISHDEGNTISYMLKKNHTYLPEYSGDITEETLMTVVNAPLLSVFQIFEDITTELNLWPIVTNYFLGILEQGYQKAFKLDKPTAFVEVTLGDYSFNGYKFCDPAETIKHSNALCALIRIKGSPTMRVLKDRKIAFSFFRHKDYKNDEDDEKNLDGKYMVENGVNDITKLGQIVQYQEKNETSFWNEGEDYKCNQVKGTDSTIYGPHNDESSVFTVFNTDICRTVELEYTGEIEYEGIPGYTSTVKKTTLNWDLPENECYSILKTKNLEGKKERLPNGFQDMYNCFEAPILVSFPHFLWAEEESYKTVTGLKENEDAHKIYIEMEPNTGSPMIGHKRIQFNIILRQYHTAFESLKNVKKSVVPIVWIDEEANIPQSLVDDIKAQYLTPVTAIDISKWVLIGVGIAMTIGCGGMYIYKRKQTKKI